MSFSLSKISWVWVLLGVIVALLVAYGSSFCVVTVYAGFLGLQVQGAPDTALINEFAASSAPGISSLFAAVGTFLGGLLAGRKAQARPAENGLMVGIITAVIWLLSAVSGGISLWGIAGVILALAGGWLGGKVAGG